MCSIRDSFEVRSFLKRLLVRLQKLIQCGRPWFGKGQHPVFSSLKLPANQRNFEPYRSNHTLLSDLNFWTLKLGREFQKQRIHTMATATKNKHFQMGWSTWINMNQSSWNPWETDCFRVYFLPFTRHFTTKPAKDSRSRSTVAVASSGTAPRTWLGSVLVLGWVPFWWFCVFWLVPFGWCGICGYWVTDRSLVFTKLIHCAHNFFQRKHGGV